ncbi:host attachment protein [Sorangium cellulosum]|uniref:host attachment protein n=1 Tax=Sorangium TaxID=39643 RepID=UPI00040FBBC6|nr:host attachment protein [Sorangium cellulosum]
MASKAARKTWILVSDASRAQLYREEPAGKGFTLLESYSHEESRARVRDLMADAHGRKPNGTPGGNGNISGGGGGTYLGRPGAAPDTDPKEVEKQKFAQELAEVLEKGLNEHAYDSLVLIAPPHFLGLLRGTVSKQVSNHIETSVDKDLSWLDEPRLTERLRELRAV